MSQSHILASQHGRVTKPRQQGSWPGKAYDEERAKGIAELDIEAAAAASKAEGSVKWFERRRVTVMGQPCIKVRLRPPPLPRSLSVPPLHRRSVAPSLFSCILDRLYWRLPLYVCVSYSLSILNHIFGFTILLSDSHRAYQRQIFIDFIKTAPKGDQADFSVRR